MTSDIESTLVLDISTQESEPENADIPFLRIHLNRNQPYLLPMNALVELLNVTIEHIMPMFCMAPWVAGVYNLRGEVLWVVDFNHFLGFAPWYEQATTTAQHTLVVVQPPATIRAGEAPPKLGLIVSEIAGMVNYPEAGIQPTPPQTENDAIQAYCQGAINSPQGWEHVLNIVAVMDMMMTAQANSAS